MPCEGRQHAVHRKAGSGGVPPKCGWYLSLFDADQSENRKRADHGLALSSAPAVLRPRDSRTRRAEATSREVR